MSFTGRQTKREDGLEYYLGSQTGTLATAGIGTPTPKGGSANTSSSNIATTPPPLFALMDSSSGKGQRGENKQQKMINTAMCAAALEECDALLALQEATLKYVKNKEPHFKTKLVESNDAVLSMEEQYHWCQPCGWSVDELINRFGLSLSGEDIQQVLKAGTPDTLGVRSLLQDLSTSVVDQSRLLQHREGLKAVNAFAPIGVADVSMNLYELLHTDVLCPAHDEVHRTNVGKTKILKKIESLTQQRDAAHAAGDIAAVEEAYHAITDCYTELLELLTTRLSHVLLSSADVENFREQVSVVKQNAEESFKAFVDCKKDLLDRAVTDYTLSEKVRQNELEHHNAAINAYAAASTISMKQLRENAAKQEAVLDIIRQQFVELRHLGETRKDIVQNHLSAKQAEEERNASYNEFTAVHAEHQALLSQVKTQTEACIVISESLSDFGGKMGRLIDQRSIEEDLRELSVDQGRVYLQHYRDAVFLIGDLSEKKQHRIEALQRTSRQLQLHRETVVESLDPNSELYTAQMDELKSQLDLAQTTVAHLYSLQKTNADNFRPTEVMLREEGVLYTHPLVEQSEVSAQQRTLSIERTSEYVEEEERVVDQSRVSVARLRQLTAEEQESSLRRLHAAVSPIGRGSPPQVQQQQHPQQQFSSVRSPSRSPPSPPPPRYC